MHFGGRAVRFNFTFNGSGGRYDRFRAPSLIGQAPVLSTTPPNATVAKTFFCGVYSGTDFGRIPSAASAAFATLSTISNIAHISTFAHLHISPCRLLETGDWRSIHSRKSFRKKTSSFNDSCDIPITHPYAALDSSAMVELPHLFQIAVCP